MNQRNECFLVIQYTSKNKVTIIAARHSRMLSAGIQKNAWIPAFAGMTSGHWTRIYVALSLSDDLILPRQPVCHRRERAVLEGTGFCQEQLALDAGQSPCQPGVYLAGSHQPQLGDG